MSIEGVIEKKKFARFQGRLSTVIKVLLVVALVYAGYYQLWRFLFTSVLLLGLLFLPLVLRKRYEVDLPPEFELTVLILTIISFLFGRMTGFIVQLFVGLVIGFVSFSLFLLVMRQTKIPVRYPLLFAVTVSLSVSIAVLAELLKYYLQLFFELEITMYDYQFAMVSISFTLLGGLIASFIGYSYMKGHSVPLLTWVVKRFKQRNPGLFTKPTDSPEEVLQLIKEGEGEHVEFKSTLRTNVHTNDHDKRIEHSVLKTICGFMNSTGGTLLIGVEDSGAICGIEKDTFHTLDAAKLHFTNLAKEKIGREFFPYFHSHFVIIEEKTVLVVKCEKAKQPVFLKHEGEEEFYIRAGNSSARIKGSDLLKYVQNRG